MTTTANKRVSPLERLAELSAARAVLHDAREECTSRKRIWALQRQFFESLHTLDVATPKRKSWSFVDINVEHPDPRVRRLRYKRKIEREILKHDPKLDPRSQRFAHELVYWMRAFDEREGIFAKTRQAIFQALRDHDRIPYSDQGIAMIGETIRKALHEYDDVEVTGELQPERQARFHVRVPTGIDHVDLHASVMI